jgi:hypothetical protein
MCVRTVLCQSGLCRSDTISLLCAAELVGPTIEGVLPSKAPLLSTFPLSLFSRARKKQNTLHLFLYHLHVRLPSSCRQETERDMVAGVKFNCIVHYYKILLEL